MEPDISPTKFQKVEIEGDKNRDNEGRGGAISCELRGLVGLREPYRCSKELRDSCGPE